MSDPEQTSSNDGPSSSLQINYIIVPLLLIFITIVAILLMKYQTWCAWKFFKPKVTKQEEPVQITHLSMLKVTSPSMDHLRLNSKDSDMTILDLSDADQSQNSSNSKSWISKLKISKDHTDQVQDSVCDDEENTITVLETNAIVYSGTPPTYGQSHLDAE